MSESIAKTMLIVKSDPNGLKGVEQFLKNREWNVVSTHDMKSAILHLMKLKPAFVLITVDHSNKKMAKFPKMIMSAFPSCVMTFAEKSTTASFKALMDSGIEYKINPPLTGPAIERAVNKYLRDLENASKQKSEPTHSHKDNNNFKVEVKSGIDRSGSGFVNVKASSGASQHHEPGMDLAENLLMQLNDDDSGSDGVAVNNLNLSQPGKASGHSGPAYQGSGGNSKANANFMQSSGIIHSDSTNQQQPNGSNSHKHQEPGPSTDADDSLWVPLSEKKDKQHPDYDPESHAARSMTLSQGEKYKKDIMIGRAKGRNDGGYSPDQPDSNDPNSPDYDSAKANEALILNPQNSKKENRQSQVPIDTTKVKQGGIFTDDSVFVKGVNKSMDETALKGDGNVQTHLEDNTHLACIVVESPKFSGYLVAALGKDKKIDDEFVELVRSRLMKFLVDAGEPVQNDANMQVKVKRVDFEGWALEYAQFLRKSVHKGDEVAMAFFPFADAQTKVGQSAEASMASVKTSEVEAGLPLEFNMYIYLPTNKKYILYTPKGSIFHANQKDRLLRQGVGEVHIKKDEVQGLSRYKAQNHLNSLIDRYDQSSQVPKVAKKQAS